MELETVNFLLENLNHKLSSLRTTLNEKEKQSELLDFEISLIRDVITSIESEISKLEDKL